MWKDLEAQGLIYWFDYFPFRGIDPRLLALIPLSSLSLGLLVCFPPTYTPAVGWHICSSVSSCVLAGGDSSTVLSKGLPIFLVLLFLQVKVTVLADNDPSSQFHYIIQVSTGYRRKASTTAKVNEINIFHSLLCVFCHTRYTDLGICQCPVAFTRDHKEWCFLVLNCNSEGPSTLV